MKREKRKETDELEVWKNIIHCPYHSYCSKNLCPLDYNLEIRPKKINDRCRWMRSRDTRKIKDKVIVSGGNTMPDVILKFVPECNLKRLNKPSQDRWLELNKN